MKRGLVNPGNNYRIAIVRAVRRADAARTSRRTRTTRGFLLAEAVTGLVLMGVMMGLLAHALNRFNNHHDALLQRSAAMLAAESVLERIRAGQPWSPDAFSEAFPGMTCRTSERRATGQWSGLLEVTVEVATRSRSGTTVRVRLRGYVPPTENQP